MTAAQIGLVKESFARIHSIAPLAARLFYERLFTIDPSLRSMFRGDVAEQGKKLMQILAVAVNALQHIDQILPAVEEMGRKHAQYGVRNEHYATVAAAFLDTLEDTLGKVFTMEVEDAWLAMFEIVAGAMQRGAARLPQAA